MLENKPDPRPVNKSVEFDLLFRTLRKTLPDFLLFEAFYVLGFPQKEIAQKMGISQRTLRKKLKKVREELAQIFIEYSRLISKNKGY